MTPEELARVTAPLESAWTLPPAAYTSAEVFDIEVEHLFRTGWVPAVHVSQIADPGDRIALDVRLNGPVDVASAEFSVRFDPGDELPAPVLKYVAFDVLQPPNAPLP